MGLALCVAPAPAAVAKCGPAKFVSLVVQGQYREQLAATGTFPRGGAMRTYINPTTRTWTVVLVRSLDGLVCIVAAGGDIDLFPLVANSPRTEAP